MTDRSTSGPGVYPLCELEDRFTPGHPACQDYPAVEPTGAQQGRIQNVQEVGGAMINMFCVSVDNQFHFNQHLDF